MFSVSEQVPNLVTFFHARGLLLLVTLAASFLLTGCFAAYARHLGMLDLPGERNSHDRPTPRGGGAGIVSTVVAVTLLSMPDTLAMRYWVQGVLPGFVLLGVVGWWDDRYSLGARVRLLWQFVACVFLVWTLGRQVGAAGLLLCAVSVGFVAWMTNLYNFMDGSNGMAGAQGVFSGAALCVLFLVSGDPGAAFLAAVIAFACLGFLPWNLGNAKVFMGDVASAPLGFAFGSLLIYGVAAGRFSAPAAWLVLLVFLCDSTLTLIARVLKGERCYTPHKQHLYQQLIVSGWSHARVLSLYQVVNLVLLVPAIAVAVNFPASALPVSILTTLLLGGGWLLAKRKLWSARSGGM